MNKKRSETAALSGPQARRTGDAVGERETFLYESAPFAPGLPSTGD